MKPIGIVLARSAGKGARGFGISWTPVITLLKAAGELLMRILGSFPAVSTSLAVSGEDENEFTRIYL